MTSAILRPLNATVPLEVDGFAARQSRVYEVHPEVSFRAMSGGKVLGRKKSWNGPMARRELLKSVGIEVPTTLGLPGDAAPDDVVDAAAAAWSAARIAADRRSRCRVADHDGGEIRRHLLLEQELQRSLRFMCFKLIEAAEGRWRRVNAPELVALVRAGTKFVNGRLIERADTEDAA